MTINSLSASSISALALSGLNDANNQITASTYRLSSGDKFYRAGDDVASLSIATKLQSNIAAGRQGLINNLQAESLLQVAYGGLTEVNDILDDMKSVAVQANSGSLTTNERAALDLQFQNLLGEIDSIADSTNFNGINLLDGTLSGRNDIETTSDEASRAQASATFTANPASGNELVLNGVTFTATTAATAATEFEIGGSIADTVQNLADVLNASTDTGVSSATYTALGNTLTITADSAGTQSNNFLIDDAASSITANYAATTTQTANVFALSGGSDNEGVFRGGTVITGTTGDSLVNTLDQSKSEVTFSFTDNPADSDTFTIDDGSAAGTITFTILDAPNAANLDEIQRGATLEETMQSMVEQMVEYRDDNANQDNYILNQLEFEIDGNDLIVRGAESGAINDTTGAAAAITETLTNGTLSGTTLNTGADTGINLAGITNSEFYGTVSGFSATFNSADDVTANITVGEHSYTAEINDTDVTADTWVRFSSTDGGGFFDVELQGGNGQSVADQGDADALANRLDGAFSTLDIYQSRVVDNFAGAGVFAGGTAEVQLDDYSGGIRVDEVSITAAPSTALDAQIEVTVNGEVFRSNNLEQSIGAYETIYLRSADDANRELRINNGNTAIDLSNDNDAAQAEDDLRLSLGLGQGGSSDLNFQIGSSTSNSVSISVDAATSSNLFGGENPDVLTQDNASAASDLIDAALDTLGSIIAEVGSAQNALQYNYNATNTSLIELDTARSLLADTDIATESTDYAAAIVQQQAAISVLAQTQLLSSNLVGLIEG